MPALDGLVVLDFTWNLPGPYATLLLAAQGAEVIKIEPPRGDPGRHIPALFARLNRGKKSVVLDLGEPGGRDQLEGLVKGADVLVEGFRPGVIDRLGCSYEQASAWNPGLVFCSISAFGQVGPAREKPGHDLNLQALSGYSHLERDSRGRPGEGVLPVADFSSSLTAVAAIGLALAERERTGRGKWIDVAMLDALAHWTSVWSEGADLLTELREQGPAGKALAAAPFFRTHRRSRLYALPHYGVFRCLDGTWLSVGVVDENRFWRAFCKELGLRGIGRLPLPARAAIGPGLKRLVAARLRTATRAHWIRRLEAADVPVTPVLSAADAAVDPRVSTRLLAPLPGGAEAVGEAPALGQHNGAVLRAGPRSIR